MKTKQPNKPYFFGGYLTQASQLGKGGRISASTHEARSVAPLYDQDRPSFTLYRPLIVSTSL